jgi:hypothetical protein
MKQFSIFLFLFFTLQSFGQDTNKGYSVVMDRSSGSVAKDSCMIYGTVKITDGSFLSGGQVVTNNYEYKCTVKSDGTYSITIPSRIKNLYFVSYNQYEVSVLDYDFKSQTKVKINFRSSSRPVQEEMVEKPVIYLYSADTTDVSLEINPTGDFSFTYPAYTDGWNVKSTPSGNVIHKGKTYPYLFWEGQHKDIGFNFTNLSSGLEGFYIKTDTCITFLENTLSYLGLNATESTDFITYWGPRIQNHPFAFIQFKELASYAAEVASMKVSPHPNSIQRIFMVFEGIDNNEILKDMTIVTPKLSPFNRWGFSLIEWGGSEVSELSKTSPIKF